MSTGADCVFYELKKGKWYYELQKWPYGETEDYDKFGPFKTLEIAKKHLSDNHANPGGYSIVRYQKGRIADARGQRP